MVTTLPRVHIALMGMERIIPRLGDLAPMLHLLPRSATGQILSSYVTLLHGPRQSGDLDGPEERHVILIDNNRTSLLQTQLEEALLCIRCGACLNACPVFQCLGGHAYASPYPGPIGSIVSPGMWGVETYGHLAKASTLCGVCREVCPVDIDLPGLLLEVREQHHRQKSGTSSKGIMIRLFTWLMTSAKRYAVSRLFASIASKLLPKNNGWIRWSPAPLNGWTKTRDLPLFRSPGVPTTQHIAEVLHSTPGSIIAKSSIEMPVVEQSGVDNTVVHWINQCRDVGGEVWISEEKDLAPYIENVIREHGTDAVLLSPELRKEFPLLIADLQDKHIEFIDPVIPENKDATVQKALVRTYDEIPLGITSVSAGLAETGSIVLSSKSVRSNFASLLPHVHIAILREENIYQDFSKWIVERASDVVGETTVIITGPSRTADIEMTLTIGVHGPTHLIVCLITKDTEILTM
jgi:L-lactate utilization protein LutB